MTRPLVLALLLVACKNEKPTDPPDGDDDDDSAPAECVADEECKRQEICDGNVCVAGDRDNTFEEATPLPGGEVPVSGIINPAGDVDTYVYDSSGAEWVSFRTVIPEGTDLDTVVTLYDADGAVQAVMDDYPVWPYQADGFDAVMYAYLPTAGSWYVTVEDRTSFYDDLSPNGD